MVENDRLTARAEEIARTVTGNAPVSVALAKRVLSRVAIGDLEAALHLDADQWHRRHRVR